MPSSLKPFFYASGVAIIGASANSRKLSYGILKNLVNSIYQGGIYPVNPGSESILGNPCYADISAVPDPVETCCDRITCIGNTQALEACGKREFKAVVIISGGFKETGDAGSSLEKRCLEIAARFGMASLDLIVWGWSTCTTG
jgi:acetyltransferase